MHGGRVDAKLAAKLCHRFAYQIPPRGRCELLVGEFADSRSTRDVSALEVSQCCVPVDSEGRGKLANVDAVAYRSTRQNDTPPLALRARPIRAERSRLPRTPSATQRGETALERSTAGIRRTGRGQCRSGDLRATVPCAGAPYQGNRGGL